MLIYDFGEDDKTKSCGEGYADGAVEYHMYHSRRWEQNKYRSEKLTNLAIGKQSEYPATVKIAKGQ